MPPRKAASKRAKTATAVKPAGTRPRKPETFDLVVAGSGIGGLATALAAAAAGFSVLVLEKDRLLGGGTALAHGGLWVGSNHIGKAQGYADTREAVVDYLRFVGGGVTEEAHLQAFVDHSPRAIRFFERCGVKLQITRGLPDHYFPAGPGSTAEGRSLEPVPLSIGMLGPWKDRLRESQLDPPRLTIEEYVAMGGTNNRQNWNKALIDERNADSVRTRGPALLAYLLMALLKRRGEVRLEAGVNELLRDRDGRVNGVRTTDGATVHARRAVVLATGGWEADAALTASFEGLPGWRSMFPDGVNGDGLRLATKAGGAVSLVRNNLALFLGFKVPTAREAEFRLSSIYELLCPHTIVVNSKGERFADESYFQNMAAGLRKFDIWAREFSNLPCYLVFDSQYVRKFSFCGAELGATPPDWVTRGDTLQALAGKLGVDPDGLAKAVERFNGFARDGSDLDFHRGEKSWTLAKREAMKGGNARNRTLGTLEEGPYYGIRLSPSAFASGGVRTTTSAQVVDGYGVPVEGLYAVGNVAAHLEYGIGYQAGCSLASGMTFGYLCVEQLKKQARLRKAAKPAAVKRTGSRVAR